MKAKIENGVEIPYKLAIEKSKYSILTTLEIGQSVFFPCVKKERKNETNKCRSQINSHGRKQVPMQKYTFRSLSEGFRVWRIK
jgi:hypothetical protein